MDFYLIVGGFLPRQFSRIIQNQNIISRKFSEKIENFCFELENTVINRNDRRRSYSSALSVFDDVTKKLVLLDTY